MEKNQMLSKSAHFELSENGFLYMLDGGERTRVTPVLAFPLEITDGYVGIYDPEGEELCIIEKLSDLDPADAGALKTALERRYYCPKIKKILSVESKAGIAMWKVETEDEKEIEFAMRDPYKSMIRVSDTRFFAVDRDGARYEIPDIEALDKKSFSKLEIYL
ncbi:MAG: DUF1854 domain-containing protein [Clostridia bacterium]|nr:DUF1854 domain-containing protein [Clostridia bacterium]